MEEEIFQALEDQVEVGQVEGEVLQALEYQVEAATTLICLKALDLVEVQMELEMGECLGLEEEVVEIKLGGRDFFPAGNSMSNQLSATNGVPSEDQSTVIGRLPKTLNGHFLSKESADRHPSQNLPLVLSPISNQITGFRPHSAELLTGYAAPVRSIRQLGRAPEKKNFETQKKVHRQTIAAR